MNETERYKVTIRCSVCGERYILRGSLNKFGQVETGFKQCICNNRAGFNTVSEPM
ncbi:hypothetical protein DFP93_103233 [Aneurinibacillus soli]|uniref:Uncharacterized protein n=1 Tax=Aneurinibacillus soli TaxID=1500254 RepID=A0A0U4WK90_9BACL|nr:hypothetical protein [Aneurinibacillus soli]PYE63021.1 hypothetical protein DFP93_103233 [Aneurinibacillus soli]BAU28920.1 hypothetical protein CB4_03097 [Aneurinibacillus soli]